MRRLFTLAATAFLFTSLAIATSHADGNKFRIYKLNSSDPADAKFKARPGIFDPDHTGSVAAKWISGVGLQDDRGNANFALYLQKAAPTATNSAAGAIIDGVAGYPASGIYGFDYRDGGQCGAGSPRYNLEATDGFHFIGGCADGTQTPLGNGWTRVTFDSSNPAQTNGVPVTPGATIISLTLIVDEGTNTGPGYIYLDNLNILGQYITKPGAAH
jgi:hypothetical protein